MLKSLPVETVKLCSSCPAHTILKKKIILNWRRAESQYKRSNCLSSTWVIIACIWQKFIITVKKNHKNSCLVCLSFLLICLADHYIFPEESPEEDVVRTVEEENLFTVAFPDIVQLFHKETTEAKDNKLKSMSLFVLLSHSQQIRDSTPAHTHVLNLGFVNALLWDVYIVGGCQNYWYFSWKWLKCNIYSKRGLNYIPVCLSLK